MTLYISRNGREVVINDAVHTHMHHAFSVAHGHCLLVLLFLTRVRGLLVLLLTQLLLAHSVLSRAISLSFATIIVIIVAAAVPAIVLHDLEALFAVAIVRLDLCSMLIWFLKLFSSRSFELCLLQSVV